MMYYAILSDVHGNMGAFRSVLEDMKAFAIDGVILLGDLVDYGMQSNEVVDCLQDEFCYDIVCNIWGNHERAILLGNFQGFSSKRGEECARHTASVLSDRTKDYLNRELDKSGSMEFQIGEKKCLAIHGCLEDPYWKAVAPDNVRGEYGEYDYVFSGHSHHSHFFTKFYGAHDPARRNKHAVHFINPGSVGQPRNHNPNAQYALLDIVQGTVQIRAVSYDVGRAMELYDGSVDLFYRDRLLRGI